MAKSGNTYMAIQFISLRLRTEKHRSKSPKTNWKTFPVITSLTTWLSNKTATITGLPGSQPQDQDSSQNHNFIVKIEAPPGRRHSRNIAGVWMAGSPAGFVSMYTHRDCFVQRFNALAVGAGKPTQGPSFAVGRPLPQQGPERNAAPEEQQVGWRVIPGVGVTKPESASTAETSCERGKNEEPGGE